jgi:hypothetical protein
MISFFSDGMRDIHLPGCGPNDAQILAVQFHSCHIFHHAQIEEYIGSFFGQISIRILPPVFPPGIKTEELTHLVKERIGEAIKIICLVFQ